MQTAARPVTKLGWGWLRRLIDRFRPDLSAEQDGIIGELKSAFLAAYHAIRPGAAGDTTVEARAAAFARERAGALITDIEDATRDGVKDLVAKAAQQNLSLDELRAAIQDYTGFDAARAQTIARTESVIASGRASRAAAEDEGHDEKRWFGGQCDDCQANAADGWIGIDEAFASGDDAEPAHPNCGCEVQYRSSAAKAVPVVAEARCPQCHRWIGRNVNVGAEVYCPQHKGVRVEA